MPQGLTFAIPNVTLPNAAALTALTGLAALAVGAVALVATYDDEFELVAQTAGIPALVANEVLASNVGGLVWQRRLVTSQRWLQQTAWGIDTAAGSDENVGTVVSPLKTFAEYRRRNVYMLGDRTITVAAGSTFPNGDPFVYNPIDFQASGAAGFASTLTITGTRTLTAIAAVAASTNVAGNVPATIDLGVALTVNSIIQATDGANPGSTAVVEYLILGTNYATSQWRSAAGAAVAPPVAGNHVSSVALSTNPLMGLSHSHIAFIVQNFEFTAVDTMVNAFVELDVCKFPGFSVINPGVYQLNGCCISGSGTLAAAQPGANITANLCGSTRAITSSIFGARVQLVNCIVAGAVATGVEAKQGGGILVQGTGIFKTTGAALDVHDGGQCEVQGTLYGDASNAGKGTRARDGGNIRVLSNVTPTLTSTGQELELESAATANPTAAGVPAVAVGLTTWAGANNWNNAATFNRFAVSYTTGASICSRA